jgi:hypothetical protein
MGNRTPSDTVGDQHLAMFSEVIKLDAGVVDRKPWPDKLKAFASANRAFLVALGWGTEEVRPSSEDAPTWGAAVATYPWLEQAANMGPSVGTLASYFTTSGWWMSNHNTFGSRLPKGFIRVVKTVLNITEGDNINDVTITDAVYFCGHGCDKRITLRSFLPHSIVKALVMPETAINPVVAEMDAWAQMRSLGMPATLGALAILKEMITAICALGMGGFKPVPEAVVALTSALNTVRNDFHLYHPGAQWAFNVPSSKSLQVADLRSYIGILGNFFVASGKHPSLVAPKHIQDLINDNPNPQWSAAGKLIAQGVEISTDLVTKAIAHAGVSTGEAAPDPKADMDAFVEYGYERSTALSAVFDSVPMLR